MPFEPLPTSDARSDPAPARVGQGLDRLLHGLGAPASRTVQGIHERWPEVVGEALAAHTRPVRVREGVLVLRADDPVWAAEIRWMGDELAAHARAVLNDDSIQRIDVRVSGA